MNSTIGTAGHGNKTGIVPGTGASRRDPKYFKPLKILQIQSDTLWQGYSYQRARITLEGKVAQSKLSKHLRKYPLKTTIIDSSVNEAYLFHGTTKEIAELIASKGFDTRLGCQLVTNKVPNGMFGNAVYLAENFSKSNQYVACPLCNGNSISRSSVCNCTPQDIENAAGYVMIVARAILGDGHICKNYTESLYKGKDMPPLKPDGKSRYDSILAEAQENYPEHTLHYREIVIYDSTQVYPEFLIYYTRHLEKPKE